MQRGNPNVWTVHFRGTCYQGQEVIFQVPLKTRYRADGKQPRATLRGMARRVYSDGVALIVQ